MAKVPPRRRASSAPRALTGPGADVDTELASSRWNGEPAPTLSVGIPTHERPEFLTELIGSLESQDFPADDFEVIVVIDATDGATLARMQEVVARTPLRVRAVQLREDRGPAVKRNVASSIARTPLIAFTDDDCLPTEGWLRAIMEAFGSGADMVQGKVLPEPGGYAIAGPWDRSLWVLRANWLFESCNIAFRRSSLESVGGFDVSLPDVTGARRPFGEDTELGWRARGAGMQIAFSEEALVYHRVHAGTYPEWLAELRRRVQFPDLVRRSPGMENALVAGVFLSPLTAQFDLAAVSSLAALLTRKPWLLVGIIPWLRRRWRDARGRPGRPPQFRLAQLAVGDAVSLLSLLEGSARARRIVL